MSSETISPELLGKRQIEAWQTMAVTKAKQMLSNDTFFPFVLAVKNKLESDVRSDAPRRVMDLHIHAFACYGAIKAAQEVGLSAPAPSP